MSEPSIARCTHCGGRVHLDAQDCGPAVGGVPPAPSNTHYAVLVFMGDLDGDHPDEALRGAGPSLTLIACGPEDFCWEALAEWAAKNLLRRGEEAEVVARHPSVIKQAGDSSTPSGD